MFRKTLLAVIFLLWATAAMAQKPFVPPTPVPTPGPQGSSDSKLFSRTWRSSGVDFSVLSDPSVVPQYDGTNVLAYNAGPDANTGVCVSTPGSNHMAKRENNLWMCGGPGGTNPPAAPGDIEVTTQPGVGICDKLNHAAALSYSQNFARIRWFSGVYNDLTGIPCLLPINNQTSANSGSNLDIWAYGVTLQESGVPTMFESNYQGNQVHLTIHGLRLSITNTSITRGFAWKQVYHNNCEGCTVILNTKAIIVRGSSSADVIPAIYQPLGTIISVSDASPTALPPEIPGTGTVWTSPADYSITGVSPNQVVTWVPSHGPAATKKYAVVFAPNPAVEANYIGNRVDGDTLSFGQQATFSKMLVNVAGQYPYVGTGLAGGLIHACNHIAGQSSYINWDHSGFYNCSVSLLLTDDPTDLICPGFAPIHGGQCLVCGTGFVLNSAGTQCVQCATPGDLLNSTGTQCQPSNTAPTVGAAPTVGPGPVGNGTLPSEVTFTHNDVEGGEQPGVVAGVKVAVSSQPGLPVGGIWNFDDNGWDGVTYVYDVSQGPVAGLSSGGPMWHGNTLIGDYKAFYYNPLNIPHILGSSDDYGGGGGYWAARRIRGGENFDELSLQGGFRQGIMGTMNGNALPAPKLSVVPKTGSDYGSVGLSTVYCYQGIAVDFAGNKSGVGPPACLGNLPTSLSTKNTLWVADAGVDGFYPRTGVCGWQIYGRTTTSALFFNPGTENCNGTPVTLKAEDGQQEIGRQIAPQWGDDGSMTSAGALPTGPPTSGVWNPSIAGMGSLPEPHYPTVASLPTYIMAAQSLPSGTPCGAFWTMDQTSGTLTDICHSIVATPNVGSGTILYSRASSVTDDNGASIQVTPGAGHNTYFSTTAGATLPSGDNWCIAFAFNHAVNNATGCMLSQKANGVAACIDAAANQFYLVPAGTANTMLQTLGGYAAGNWNFAVVSDTNKVFKVRINNADVTRQTQQIALTPADTTMYFFIDSTIFFNFNGNLDNISTYQAPCTDQDMDSLYSMWVKKKNGMHAYAEDVGCSFLMNAGAWKAQECGTGLIANLPDCTKVKGGTAMVTNNTAACSFWVNPVAGGANSCRVTCDGSGAATGWKID